MATYNITKNSLLFFSAKDFLDSINTIFEFRFVQTGFPKWVLEFRPIDELIWQCKPLSICLTNNLVKKDVRRRCYAIGQIGYHKKKIFEEDGHILKMYYTLHELLVKALDKSKFLLPDFFLPEPVISVSDFKVGAPFEFVHDEFPDWQKVPGQSTIRFGNATFSINDGGIKLFWSFNIWKYRKNDKSVIPTNKRKLEPENTTEPVPELAKRVCQENCDTTEPVPELAKRVCQENCET